MTEINTVQNVRGYIDAGDSIGIALFGKLWKPSKPIAPKLACVYALEMSDGTVKIGVTRNIETRPKEVASAVYLKVQRVYHTGFAPFSYMHTIEQACHAAFESQRVRGEFFQIPFEKACFELDKHAEEITESLKAADKAFLVKIAQYEQWLKAHEQKQPDISISADFGNATKKIQNTIADVGKATEILQQTFGIKHIDALSAAIDIVAKISDERAYSLKKLLPFCEDNPHYFYPNQLAKKLGLGSGTIAEYKVDNLLKKKGFQYYDGRDWRLTDLGSKYGVETSTVDEKTWRSGYQIRWNKSVLEELRSGCDD